MSEGEAAAQTGTCKWFNVLKGYGFITPDAGGEDIFVHQTELRMDGFRSLDTGERVRYIVRKRNEGTEATRVESAEPGGTLKGSSIRPLGKNKPHAIRCYKCGNYGNHTAAKCKTLVTNEKACYGCHGTDHLIANCPVKANTKTSKDEKIKNGSSTSEPKDPIEVEGANGDAKNSSDC